MTRLGRLTALEDRYDPTNAFRMNANIAPTGWFPAPDAAGATLARALAEEAV